MKVPVAMLCTLSPEQFRERPGRGRALRASEMLDALQDVAKEFLGTKVTPDMVQQLRAELTDIMRHQARIRSSSVPVTPDVSMTIELTEGSTLSISCTPRWTESVDRHFRNGSYPICGGLVTPGVHHTLEECDFTLASAVIES
jgi:hypothetical protein